jgi:hypothetical protein
MYKKNNKKLKEQIEKRQTFEHPKLKIGSIVISSQESVYLLLKYYARTIFRLFFWGGGV